MQIELVTWRIIGTRPLIQNRYDVGADPVRGDDGELKVAARKRYVPKPRYEEAAKQLYESEGRFYHPAGAFWKAMIAAGVGRKFKSIRADDVIARAVQVCEEEFWLLDPDTLDAKKPRPLRKEDWTVDCRPAVNYNCKPPARIPVARPKWRKWGGLLTLEVERDFFGDLTVLTDVLMIAGRFGIGAGRIRKEERGKQMVWSGLNCGKFVAELKV